MTRMREAGGAVGWLLSVILKVTAIVAILLILSHVVAMRQAIVPSDHDILLDRHNEMMDSIRRSYSE